MKYIAGDKYCYINYPNVLISKFDIKDNKQLEQVEELIILKKTCIPEGKYDLKHLQAIHQYLFEDIYDWAGQIREVNIAKNSTIFCMVGFIEKSYDALYTNLKKENFFRNQKGKDLSKSLAVLHSEINIIHPFREGNGRSTREFIKQLIRKECNLDINYKHISSEEMMQGSIDGVNMDYDKMMKVYEKLLYHTKEKKKDYSYDR